MDLIETRKVLPFFKGKKVFVTGHTGFKGSWLVFLLKEIGATVKGFALEPESDPNHFDLLSLKNDIDHTVGDIRNESLLKKAILDFQPDFVFHLAAQALVKDSYNDPVKTFETNVMGSVNLLNAVRQCDSIRSLVFITSDKCYENVDCIWGYREDDRLGGIDPYSASKSAAEIVFSSFNRSYFLSKENFGAASARAGNVIGGGDWSPNRILPDCIRAINLNEPIKIRKPNATRPWQHVLEPISGYLSLGVNLYHNPSAFTGTWNFGPPTSQVKTVDEVAKMLIKLIGKGSIEIDKSNNYNYEANMLQLNCDKAIQLLDWRPRWDINKTLEATVQWYKVFLNEGDIESITKSQLYEYFKDEL